MNAIPKGVLAGFGATIVLSALMLLKGAMGMLPNMNVIVMLAHMGHKMLALPMTPVVGWLAHFFIGTILWGLLYALTFEFLPGKTAVAKGLAFSVGAWLLMMILVMPMAGKGLFGLGLGVMAPVATLVLHLIWGASLGFLFSRMPASQATAHGT